MVSSREMTMRKLVRGLAGDLFSIGELMPRRGSAMLVRLDMEKIPMTDARGMGALRWANQRYDYCGSRACVRTVRSS